MIMELSNNVSYTGVKGLSYQRKSWKSSLFYPLNFNVLYYYVLLIALMQLLLKLCEETYSFKLYKLYFSVENISQKTTSCKTEQNQRINSLPQTQKARETKIIA